VELHRWASKERSRAIGLCIIGVARAVTTGLRVASLASDRLVRDFLTVVYQRGAVRALQRLDDTALADMGVSRCQIEPAVRAGSTLRAIRKIEYRYQKQRLTSQWKSGLRLHSQQPSVAHVTRPAA
jgi:uncharacterized protein YjiS (DUF1127 family)